jgi:hypothetical protein
MTPTEIMTTALSVVSLLVAGFAAYRTYALSHSQLRIAARHEFQRLLLDIDKELVRDPSLWGVYDAHPMGLAGPADPMHKAKLEAFAYMLINMCHVAFVFSQEMRSHGKIDEEVYTTWTGTFEDFLKGSSLGREILARPESVRLYGATFLDYARKLVKAGVMSHAA